MKVEVIKCNYCDESTEDIEKEQGWISFESFKGSISGCRKSDVGDSQTLRYFNNDNETHFCSLWCLIMYLYKDKKYFNHGSMNNLADYLKHCNVGSGAENKLNEIYREVDKCLDILNPIEPET